MNTDRITLPLWNPQQAHVALMEAWRMAKALLMAGHRLVLEIRPEKRSDAQNRTLWSALRDVAGQVDWYGNKLSDEEWKHVFSASLKRQKVVPGLDGGFVVLGQSTSRMTKGEFSELMELIWAFGSEREVKWSPTSLGGDE